MHASSGLLRRLAVIVGISTLVVAACGDSGPDADPPRPGDSVCGDNFCVAYPDGWIVAEDGGSFVSLENTAAPEQLRATVSQVNMEGVVTQAGGTWPQVTDGVVRSFWTLLGETGATLSTLDPRADGSVASLGTYEDGRLWILVAPIDATNAIGIEVRAPNTTWADHVAVLFDSLQILE